MRISKKAFTITELMFVLLVIGIIISIQIRTINTRINQYSAGYFNTYHALKKAAYNVLADMYCPGPSCPDETLRDPNKGAPRPFPEDSENLCLRLAEFINTTQLNCKAPSVQVLGTGGLNLNNEMPDGTNRSTVKFVAGNSYRFHISDMKEYEINNSSGVHKVKYFIVFVDINGEKKPNSFYCNEVMGDFKPDIVPFVITTKGEVIPVGWPIHEKTYMTAHVKLPVKLKEDKDRRTKSLTFYEAVHGAWPDGANVYEHHNIPFSVQFNDIVNKDGTNNDFLKQCFFTKEADYKNTAAGLSFEDEGCLGGTYSCRVVIEQPTTTRF